MISTKTIGGKLGASLLRSKSKIKEERAIAIWRTGERFFKRQVEDLEAKLEDMEINKQAMLDLSPTDANSLVAGADFDAEDFYKAHLSLALKMRETRIQLEEAKAVYNDLFVAETDITDPKAN